MRSRKSESGFALLFIYAMAATVAVMLYMELPRVAFEAQRDKEQLLIDRGEQIFPRGYSLCAEVQPLSRRFRGSGQYAESPFPAGPLH